MDPLTRMLAEFVATGEWAAGTLKVVTSWDGHLDVGGEYGQ